jgi:hypothetical protein
LAKTYFVSRIGAHAAWARRARAEQGHGGAALPRTRLTCHCRGRYDPAIKDDGSRGLSHFGAINFAK